MKNTRDNVKFHKIAKVIALSTGTTQYTLAVKVIVSYSQGKRYQPQTLPRGYNSKRFRL